MNDLSRVPDAQTALRAALAALRELRPIIESGATDDTMSHWRRTMQGRSLARLDAAISAVEHCCEQYSRPVESEKIDYQAEPDGPELH